MEQTTTVALALLTNRSGREYEITYGPGHKTTLPSFQSINVKQLLFDLSQSKHRPLESKITFEEVLPKEYPDWTRKRAILDFKIMKSCLAKLYNNANVADHALEDHDRYTFNITINEYDDLVYDLIKEIK